MEKFDLENCTICPRMCKADRINGRGACGEGAEMRVAKIMLHRWEEPCISGCDPNRGSGAIFFSGCPLHCVYCQNKAISSGGTGEVFSPHRLALEMKKLEEAGAYNINFVTPTHFIPKIIESLQIYRPKIPTVFNTSGYERVETLYALAPYGDIFLADLKYADPALSKKYSNAPDYPEIAIAAIKKMKEITGPCILDGDGMLKRGTVVRHLVLPSSRRDSVRALEMLKNEVGSEGILLSLMSQYTPDFAPDDVKELKRRTTTFEYEYVRDKAVELGFEGFGQDKASAKRAYTPEF